MARHGDLQLQLLLEEVGRHVAAAADAAGGLIDLILQTLKQAQQCVRVCVFTLWKIFFHI